MHQCDSNLNSSMQKIKPITVSCQKTSCKTKTSLDEKIIQNVQENVTVFCMSNARIDNYSY
ncbi:43747_t:CDS:2 [Gigaspora margarita]|uniref:43747_t:CDS:1 n=1 Tax=Gigaspora margarita TaxID=4874 RepID=A0ABN7U9J5_GIGMA|nr:43747_t:CDS:2 [Gigaspora margarita]